MRNIVVTTLLVFAAAQSWAQIAPQIEEDTLPVLIPAVQPPATVATPTVAAPQAPVVAAPTIPAALVMADIIVSNVTVTVSNSTGQEREGAMATAARLGLPRALLQLDPPVTGERAREFIDNQGDVQRYVKSARIVREVLVPSYSLTVDLTYNGERLRANLGGRVPVMVSGTALSPQPEDTRPRQVWEVQLISNAPAESARFYQLLNSLPSTQARYLSLTTRQATYAVKTPETLAEIEQKLMEKGLSTVPGAASGLRVSY